MIEITKITQAQMEAGETNPAADPSVNPTGSKDYRDRFAAFLAERPFGAQQIACAVAVLRANMVLPNERGLYELELNEEQWFDLIEDKPFVAMFGRIGKYLEIRGTIDVLPLGVRLRVG